MLLKGFTSSLFDSGKSSGDGSKSVPGLDSQLVACVPVFIAGDFGQAFSPQDVGLVRRLGIVERVRTFFVPSSVARWLTPSPCRSTRGSFSSSTAAITSAVPSPSTSSTLDAANRPSCLSGSPAPRFQACCVSVLIVRLPTNGSGSMPMSCMQALSSRQSSCYVLTLSLCHALIFLSPCVPPDRFSAFYRTHLGLSRYLDT